MTATAILDFRSDTVTLPDPVMCAAMGRAELGDDVLDGDPTMRRLEERAATVLGTEAALWVPSGSMGNLIALFLQVRRGERLLAPAQAHVLDQEVGTAFWLAGATPGPLPWRTGAPGRPAPDAVRTAAASTGPYFALRTTGLCLENTHNAAGGTVTTVDEHDALIRTATDAGLWVHLDGARIWNAAVRLGVAPARLTRGVTTVQACLSKGLGAPVGSVLGGSVALIAEARRARKMLGGGIRQGGMLAAAGLVALDRIARLRTDHETARVLASGLCELGWDVDVPETNVVMCRVENPDEVVRRLGARGLLTVPVVGRVRWMTHSGVDRAAVGEALGRLAQVPT
ncbi:low specificity L-threonine aldolase [Pseudonocardia sp. ICBG601]|uniref:threonine aldolase family protein n=1 Tax=Pseudonocardia sp. ICBG601 TaxID=2846759 RepID=UPI001CF6417C|nr:GntG family PLP-dependent aldolase [Pseudonocardia sp. ICBG601]